MTVEEVSIAIGGFARSTFEARVEILLFQMIAI